MRTPVSKIIKLQGVYVFYAKHKKLEKVVLLYNIYIHYIYANNFYMIIRSKFGYLVY